MGLSERLEIDLRKAHAELEALARECGLSGADAAAFVDEMTDQIYKGELVPAVTEAGQILKGSAPDVRDVRAQTYAFIADESDADTAVVVFVSDSKRPDVLRKNKATLYDNGVDLSNVTNGRLGPRRANGFQSQRKTGRSRPMPSEGWWLRGLKAAARSITG